MAHVVAVVRYVEEAAEYEQRNLNFSSLAEFQAQTDTDTHAHTVVGFSFLFTPFHL